METKLTKFAVRKWQPYLRKKLVAAIQKEIAKHRKSAEVVLDKNQQAELAKLINDTTPPTHIFEVDGDNLCNALNHACRRRKN